MFKALIADYNSNPRLASLVVQEMLNLCTSEKACKTFFEQAETMKDMGWFAEHVRKIISTDPLHRSREHFEKVLGISAK